MTTAGIIGGIGPESTIEYYRLIVASYRQRTRDGSYPSLLINSIDMKRMLDLIEANEMAAVTAYLLAEVTRLAQAGADFGVLASNTPHLVFEPLNRQSPIPLISIVETACDAAKALRLRRIGLLGTRFTMQGRFYVDVFDREGITLVATVARLKDQDGIDGIILGGTELPLILGDVGDQGIPFLNTTRIHVERIVARLVL
jgi:aspartate racemase